MEADVAQGPEIRVARPDAGQQFAQPVRGPPVEAVQLRDILNQNQTLILAGNGRGPTGMTPSVLLYSHFVLRPTLVLLVLSGLPFAACGRRPPSYPPPEQAPLDMGLDPTELLPFVRMSEAIADNHLVRDIGGDPGAFRWAFVHPEMRFMVKDTRNLKFAMEIGLPEVTFRVTGPVTISCSINGKFLTSARYDHPGTYTLGAPVPSGWVEAGKPISVTAEADRRWTSPNDGAQLSFTLMSAGFTQ